jgi:MFS transporter, PAT family, beta-lactamase induction signal transducer AmpG
MINKAEHRNPWYFVPTLAFTLGITLIIVNQVASMMYASLGVSTQLIGVLTILGLPIAFNVFFAPFVDSYSTKRNWILGTQAVLVVCLLLLAFCLLINFHVVAVSIVLVGLLALATGVYAIPNGGFFVEALTKKEQGFFVGINTAFIRIAIIFTTGVLVIISGKFGEKVNNIYYGWSLFFFMCAFAVLVMSVWHLFIMPYPKTPQRKGKPGYLAPFKEFFTQQGALLFVSYILVFRLGEGLLTIMSSPFFLNSTDQGGLGMTVAEVGFAKGTVGVAASIVGGVLAGVFLKGKHYRKMIIIFAICMTAPNALYIYLARFQPQDMAEINLSFIPALWGSAAQWTAMVNIKTLTAIAIETFGYGLGYTAFVFVVYRIAEASSFRATTISIAMALQNVGWTFSGFVSGFIQSAVGYEMLFTLSIILSIPGIILLVLLLRKRDI